MTWLFNQEYAANAFAREQREEGKAEGRVEGAREITLRLHAAGMIPSQIAELIGYSVETICQWISLPMPDSTPTA